MGFFIRCAGTRHLTIAYIQRGIGAADRSMYLVNEPIDSYIDLVGWRVFLSVVIRLSRWECQPNLRGRLHASPYPFIERSHLLELR